MGRKDISIGGRTGKEWAALCEDDEQATVARWQRWLSGRTPMPMWALLRMVVTAVAQGDDLPEGTMIRWAKEIDARRDATS